MRGLRSIIKRVKNPNAVIVLQQRTNSHEKGSAFASKAWSDKDILEGVIYSPKNRNVNEEGMYDGGQRKGVFIPGFNIDNMTDFRLKVYYYTDPNEDIDPYKTEIYSITSSNQDLYLRGKKHHIELDLKISQE